LAFQPPVVEVEKLVALGGASLRGMQLQLLEGLDDGVELVERGGWTGVGACTSPPSAVMRKSRFL
jgi:hypothetical protein